MEQERCTPKFLDLIKAVKASNVFEFPELKAMFVAQCILECGRGTTDLFKLHSNPFGMHYHDFMSNYATGVSYEACDGVAIYAKFVSFDNVVKAYFSWFDYWTHYGAWRVAARKGPLAFLKHIGPHYCPPGFTEAWKQAHSGLDYADYIINKLLPEAEKLISETPTSEEPSMELKKVSWFEMNRANDGKPFITAYDGATACYTHPVTTAKDLYEWVRALNGDRNSVLVAETDKKIIPKCPDIYGETPPVVTGKRGLIDPGHSESSPGARGKNSSVQEEDLNRYQAEVLQAELKKLGIEADIYDPANDDLVAIGKKAQGYAFFVSLHLNAYDNKEHYTCTMCHSKLQSPSSRSAKAASAFAQAVAGAIGNPCFGGSPGWPKGVMAAGLSVLNGASQTNCPIAFLSELEFCDDETSPDGLKERIRKGMAAGARALAGEVA